MFGLNNAIRSIATGTASSVDSLARTTVGSLALVEKAVTRRLDENYQKRKVLALNLESIKDLHETAKSCGFPSIEDGIKEIERIDALLK